MVLVDALRPDYVRPELMPFVHALSDRSATGELRECFGFVVARAAYFAGLSTEQYGFSNMYCFDPEQSPFSIARTLPGEELDRKTAADLRAFVDESAREQMSPFAKAYANSAEIPLNYLASFDLVEKHAPWEAGFECRSLFNVLDEGGMAWHQSSWPETNHLADQSDAGIVRHVLGSLTPEHRFAYVHLQELDAVGHRHGPNSVELQDTMATTDQCCRDLIETARARYGAVNVVLFGDHGMVNVTRTLDLSERLENTGLEFGIDYAYFLDSTMARFWFYNQAAREAVETALGNVAGGHLLDEQALAAYEIAECDSRNGELVFLADPGVLIFPNFFQGSGEPIKGMHGYDPDCADNLGFFMVHNAAVPPNGDLGKIDPQAIYPFLLELTGFAAATHTDVPLPVIQQSPVTASYTRHTDPAAETAVSDQLKYILAALEERVGQVEAIVLTGSFGRGEGGVYQDADGRYCPVNDYDLIIADPRDLNNELAGLGERLARELNIDFVDLAYSNGCWKELPPTIFNYDLKYGSRVIAGNPAILDQIPAYAAGQFTADDPVRLLLNRMAGLLSGISGNFIEGQSCSFDEQRYLTNQMVKAWIAIGDAYLILWSGYDSSYVRRKERFVSLAPGAGLDAKMIERIALAYGFKCLPDYAAFTCGLPELQELFGALEKMLQLWIERMTGSASVDLFPAMQAYLDHYRVELDSNSSCRSNPALAAIGPIQEPLGVPVRHLIYGVLPLLLSGVIKTRACAAFQQAQELLEEGFKCPSRKEYTPEHWEELRADVVAAWFAVCH